MKLTARQSGAITAAILEGQPGCLAGPQDALDLIGDASYNHNSHHLIIPRACFSETFFDLSTGQLGEVFQKFTNYGCSLAVVGDFSDHPSKSLRDFIYESNRVGRFLFAATAEEALAKWAAA